MFTIFAEKPDSINIVFRNSIDKFFELYILFVTFDIEIVPECDKMQNNQTAKQKQTKNTH